MKHKPSSNNPIIEQSEETPRLRHLRLNPRARALLQALKLEWRNLGLILPGYGCSKSTARALLREMESLSLIETRLDDYRQRSKPRLLYRLLPGGIRLKEREGLL